MPHFCMFGAYEGQFDPGQGIYVTIFGGSDLKRSPAASQLVEQQRLSAAGRNGPRHFFFTLFGGTTITWPTSVLTFAEGSAPTMISNQWNTLAIRGYRSRYGLGHIGSAP